MKIKKFHGYILLSRFHSKIRKNAKIKINTLQLKQQVSENHKFHLKGEVLIITSPLTENGNARYVNQEIDILDKLLKQNPHKSFILKPHYREIYNLKYSDLIKQYENVQMIDEQYLDLPVQELPVLWREVIGFHSTALDYFLCFECIKVYTLSGIVESQHSRAVMRSLITRAIVVKSDCKIGD